MVWRKICMVENCFFPLGCLKEELLKYNNPIIHHYTLIVIHQKILIPCFPIFLHTYLYTFCPLCPTPYSSFFFFFLVLNLICLPNYIGNWLCFIKFVIYEDFDPTFAHRVLNILFSNTENRQKMPTSFWECRKICQVIQGLTMHVKLRMITLATE